MPVGPGKYDPICTEVMRVTAADAAVVIIANGILGFGFSMQAKDTFNGLEMAKALEICAKQIRADWEAAIEQSKENPDDA